MRHAEVIQIFDYGFAQYKVEKVLSTESVLGTKMVNRGKNRYAALVPMENVSLLYKKQDNKKMLFMI